MCITSLLFKYWNLILFQAILIAGEKRSYGFNVVKCKRVGAISDQSDVVKIRWYRKYLLKIVGRNVHNIATVKYW